MFAGGFSLEAAEVVGEGEGIGRSDVLESLLMLVDKSLVVAGRANEGGSRYRLLEPVSQYARERLEESREAERVRRRHAVGLIRLGGHLKIVGWRFSERSCSGATNKTTVSTPVQGGSHKAYALLREASCPDLP